MDLGKTGKKVVASKPREVVGDEVTSKNVEWEKNLQSIRSFAFLIENIRYEKAIKIAYEKELFGEKVDFHLQKVDMGYICELKEVSLTCIVVYMSYLYDVMKVPNKHGSFLFVNPYTIGAKCKPGDNANATLLARRLEDAKPGELVVAPCNIGFHWSLLVIDVSSSTVYYLDSLVDEVPMDIKILIRCAMIIYEGDKGNKMKNLVWQVVQCPKQPTSVECGFYVMMFMRDLMKDKSILSKNNFNGRKTYTEAEIDEVRVEWINFVMTKYEQQLF